VDVEVLMDGRETPDVGLDVDLRRELSPVDFTDPAGEVFDVAASRTLLRDLSCRDDVVVELRVDVDVLTDGREAPDVDLDDAASRTLLRDLSCRDDVVVELRVDVDVLTDGREAPDVDLDDAASRTLLRDLSCRDDVVVELRVDVDVLTDGRETPDVDLDMDLRGVLSVFDLTDLVGEVLDLTDLVGEVFALADFFLGVGAGLSSLSVLVSGSSVIGSTVGSLFIGVWSSCFLKASSVSHLARSDTLPLSIITELRSGLSSASSCFFLKASSFSHLARSDTLILSSFSGLVSSGSGCFLPNAAPLCINFILSAKQRFSGSTSAMSETLPFLTSTPVWSSMSSCFTFLLVIL